MPFCVYVHNLERILWRSVYNINSLPFVRGFFYNCLSFIYSNWASSSFGAWSHLCGEGLSFWLGCWHVVFMKKRLKCYHLLILKVLSRVLDLYFQINADSGAVQESCRGDFLLFFEDNPQSISSFEWNTNTSWFCMCFLDIFGCWEYKMQHLLKRLAWCCYCFSLSSQLLVLFITIDLFCIHTSIV